MGKEKRTDLARQHHIRVMLSREKKGLDICVKSFYNEAGSEMLS